MPVKVSKHCNFQFIVYLRMGRSRPSHAKVYARNLILLSVFQMTGLNDGGLGVCDFPV